MNQFLQYLGYVVLIVGLLVVLYRVLHVWLLEPDATLEKQFVNVLQAVVFLIVLGLVTFVVHKGPTMLASLQ